MLRVRGLSGDSECVTDLFPGPATVSGQLDAVRLDLFSKPVQGAYGTQTHGGIIRLQVCAQTGFHGVSVD